MKQGKRRTERRLKWGHNVCKEVGKQIPDASSVDGSLNSLGLDYSVNHYHGIESAR